MLTCKTSTDPPFHSSDNSAQPKAREHKIWIVGGSLPELEVVSLGTQKKTRVYTRKTSRAKHSRNKNMNFLKERYNDEKCMELYKIGTSPTERERERKLLILYPIFWRFVNVSVISFSKHICVGGSIWEFWVCVFQNCFGDHW